MDDDVYQSAVGNSKENPFKRYLEYRKQLDELTEDEKLIYGRHWPGVHQPDRKHEYDEGVQDARSDSVLR